MVRVIERWLLVGPHGVKSFASAEDVAAVWGKDESLRVVVGGRVSHALVAEAQLVYAAMGRNEVRPV